MTKKVNFKTNTLLKNLVGKDLINDDNIAVVELVKNSFDAKSASVTIKFTDFLENEITDHEVSKIIIADAGSGMDESDIREKWLNIAYSEKKNISKGKEAYYAGNKGIGRFSCDRLGEQLDLFTRKKNGDLLHLKINWLDFEIENEKDLTIQEIDILLSRVSDIKAEKIAKLSIPDHGTILVISKLRSNWGRNELTELKRSLERFINPNQIFSKDKFLIKLVAEDLKKSDRDYEEHFKINCTIKNVIFEKLKFKTTYIESVIDAEGEKIITNLFHEGEKVFKTEEKNLNFLNLKNIKIIIYYLNPYKKAYFKKETGVRSIDFGSIFLFLNGFRVAPYGERGDDWLGLDIRKAQGQQRFFGNRDVVGRIEVVDDEEKFKPISSREGIKNTVAAIELKTRFFESVLRKLERFVVDGLDWDSVPKERRSELLNSEGLDWEKTSEKYTESWDKKKRRIATSIMSLVGTDKSKALSIWFNAKLLEGMHENRQVEVERIIKDINGFNDDVIDIDLKKELRKIGALVEKKDIQLEAKTKEIDALKIRTEDNESKIEELTLQKDNYFEQTLFLKSITSIDHKNLLGFLHQICLDSSIVNNYINKVMVDLRKVDSNKSITQNIEKISKANKRIMATAQFASKANFRSGSKKELTNIPMFFEQYILNVAKDFVASDIRMEIVNNHNGLFELNARRIELSILIDNLISNADKAHAKNIKVLINSKNENEIFISFVDDGSGLSKNISNAQDVFDLGVTTTNGSGLGLFHAKEIVESLGGKIEFIPLSKQGVEVKMVFAK